MKVFVHLARNKDAIQWRIAKDAGSLVGRNDYTPYGYGRASNLGCEVVFSQSRSESFLAKTCRLGARVLSGFDYFHAKQQLGNILQSDIVWTHTESQFLGVAAALRNVSNKPRILGQAVWLLDKWPQLSPVHKSVYKELTQSIDVLITHSNLNAEAARKIFPKLRIEVVPFGIPCDNPIPPSIRPSKPIRIIAVGNDRHRDWSTLVESFGNFDGFIVDILSNNVSKTLAAHASNVIIRPALTNQALEDAYAIASIAVVPLVPNLHASGATVIQEAVLAGVPLVASDVGGLRTYFNDDEITYVPPGNPLALREAVITLVRDPNRALQMAIRAQAKMLDDKIGVNAYIKRHVELSSEILGCASV